MCRRKVPWQLSLTTAEWRPATPADSKNKAVGIKAEHQLLVSLVSVAACMPWLLMAAQLDEQLDSHPSSRTSSPAGRACCPAVQVAPRAAPHPTQSTPYMLTKCSHSTTCFTWLSCPSCLCKSMTPFSRHILSPADHVCCLVVQVAPRAAPRSTQSAPLPSSHPVHAPVHTSVHTPIHTPVHLLITLASQQCRWHHTLHPPLMHQFTPQFTQLFTP